MLLLAFGHKARNGKDLCARAIKDYFEYTVPVELFPFAGALYDVCRNEYGMTEKDPDLLQRIGHGRRQEDPLYWVKRNFLKIDMWASKLKDPANAIAIITDLRYLNEAEYIHSRGGKLIKVVRIDVNGLPFIAPDRDPNHPSEIDLDSYTGWDAFIIAKDTGLKIDLATRTATYFLEEQRRESSVHTRS